MREGLYGKVVLITGATGGLGSAVTREFARTPTSLVLTARSQEKLERLVAEAGLSSARTLIVPADVTQADAVEHLANEVRTHYGGIDVLLNTAGGWRGGKPVWEAPLEEWDFMLALNLHSAFFLSRAVLPHMLEAGWGRIVHVSSKAAVAPRAKRAAYAVSKMGLITLTEIIAAEVKGTGVTANVILPSVIDTPANRASMPKADPSKWVPPERIAATMQFLCSDAAESINGARVPVYGAV